jgi:hypothetical protein
MNQPLPNRRRFLAACAASTIACGGLLVRPSGARQTPAAAGGPEIDCDFPGGNIVLDRIDGDAVYLHQDPRDTAGFWFYWYFRVRGAAGRTLRFRFTDRNVIGVRGPAVSTDGGRSWSWLGTESVQGASFAYAFPADVGEVRFCLAFPYFESNLDEFLRRHEGNPSLVVEHHATSLKGRAVRRLRLGRLDGEPEHRVLLACRHHCCEMMASWALEGIMEAVLSDAPDGVWFRRHIELAVVPFMDADGVADGDQGKNRKPHDHNRDYLGESIYPEVAALREFVPRWSQGKLRIALDMHCPYLSGRSPSQAGNEDIYFVAGRDADKWAELEKFSAILEETRQGPLPYRRKQNLPHGQMWNTLAEPRSFSRWAALQPGVTLAAGMEIPYATATEVDVTDQSARALGRDLARAMRVYLESCDR